MTTIVNDESIESLSNSLCVKDRNGEPILMIGFVVTLFIENSWAREVKEAVAEVAHRYISENQKYLRWARTPGTGQMHRIETGKVPFPKEWLPKTENGEGWDFGFHGGSSEDAVSGYQLDALGNDCDKDYLGYFHITFPVEWCMDHIGGLPPYVLGMCERLKPVSGYAGLGLIESPSILTAIKHQAVGRQFAQRFPGLEIEDRLGHAVWLPSGIKGVNWLTILGDHWVNEIGGLDYLNVRLGSSFHLCPFEGGLMIQAGQKPQIGDVKANRWPELYVILAKVLKRIQIAFHGPMHNGGKDTLDHEATMKWINRFDDH